MKYTMYLMAAATGLGLGAMPGCTQYQPKPLDLSGYTDAWAERMESLSAEWVGADEAGNGDVAGNGLTLAQAEVIALRFNPGLRHVRSQAGVPFAGAQHAGRWDDPEFDFELLRFAESVADPWILGTGLSFTIPLSGRLEVATQQAWAEYDAAWWEVVVAEAELVAELRASWIELATARDQEIAIEQAVAELDELGDIANQLVRAGELNPTDARVIELDRLDLAADLQEIQAAARAHELRIHRLAGLMPSANVQFDAGPPASPPTTSDKSEALLDHPRLHLARAEYEAAELDLNREIRKQYPDLTIGPAYELEEGQSRIGLGLGIPIPILNANQQGIAESEARREAARAAAERVFETLVHELAEVEAQRDAAVALGDLIQGQSAVVIQNQIDDIRRLAQLGEVNVLLISDALDRAHDNRVDRLDAHRQAALADNLIRALTTHQWRSSPTTRETSEIPE